MPSSSSYFSGEKSELTFKNSSSRHGGYFGPKETPYAAVLSAQEKQIAGVIVHLQVNLSLKYLRLTSCRRESDKIFLFDFLQEGISDKIFLFYFLQEGIRYNLHQIMEVEKTNISCLSMPQNK